jgi:predicted transposase/invertase (TIGR01784 family)
MQKLGKLESKKREDYLRKLFYLMRLRPNIAKKLREKEKEDKMPFILDREIDPLYQEGVEKGIEEGKAEATKETKIAIAKSLLDLLDDETIAKKTTLSVKEVKKLRATGS